MKISIKFILSIALIACSFSCKDLLKEVNPSGTTAEAVFTTGPGFETLVNGAYSYNRWWYGKEEGFGASEMGTDLWTAGSETFIATSGVAGDNRALILYQNLNSVNGNLTRLWKKMYAAVNLCNAGIKIAETGGLAEPGSFVPDAKRVAELRFLRAWYYWHIVETWGGVHFTTEPTMSEILTANRTPVSTFYDLIISDLNKALVDLPATKASISDYGRVHGNVAKAFLARVHLTRGWINNDPADFTLAKSYADQVIAAGYTLVSDYESLWAMDVAKQHNTEVIWSVNYAVDPAASDVYDGTTNPYGYGEDILSAGGNPTNNRGNNNAHLFFINGYDRAYDSTGGFLILQRDVRYGRPFIRFKPTRHLLTLFNDTIDSRYDGSFQTVWKLNKTGLGRLTGKTKYVDTALVIDKYAAASTQYYTFDAFNGYNPDGTSATSVPSTNNQLFPALKKFMDSTRYGNVNLGPSEAGSGNVQSAKDIYVIRLAEMYMIAAEAEFKLNGANATAAGYIDVLRTRAAKPGQVAAMTATTLADLTARGINYILDERAREFAGEQIRWFDLKRTGTLASRIAAYNPDLALYFMPTVHVVRPIPQQQIDAVTNKSEFTQNSGY